VSTVADGSVTVSATKTVSSRLTGNPASPVVPLTNQPATFTITSAGMGEFRVGSSGASDENSLLAHTGVLSGSVSPRVFVGADTGVCSVSSPNADFANVAWSDADLLLSSSSGSFALAVDSAALTATNGTTALGTNLIAGEVVIEGESFTVPGDDDGLVPGFDANAFDAAWQCNPDLASPPSDACAQPGVAQLAGGAAALSMRTLGVVASLIDADTTCGFSSLTVAGDPVFSGGGVGDDDVTATFTVGGIGCTITLAPGTPLGPDCNGDESQASGTIVVTGTKTVTGWRTGDPLEPIVPDSAHAVVFDLDVTFTDFDVQPDPDLSTAALAVTSGALSGTVTPRLALDPRRRRAASPRPTWASRT
jgi:hypothetical protein